MQTRSTKSSSKRATPVLIPSRHNQRWTVMEEREMVRLRRLENKTFEEIALSLNRDTEAIKLRFEKLLMEHTDGESDVSEALRWFNLSA
jgi:hypothetical protein